MGDITQILADVQRGDPLAAEQLLPQVYEELRKLAAAKLSDEQLTHTLQATALVHEAYIRLVKPPINASEPKAIHWDSRAHFFGAAAEAMRRILVEQARRKKSIKGGGRSKRVELRDDQVTGDENIDLLAVNDALDKLAVLDSRKAELVKLRFFAGLTLREAAELLEISESTADADWAYAKCWLRVELDDCSA